MIEKGFCQCGCGRKTWIARSTDHKWGYIKGEPVRFYHGHSRKGKNKRGYSHDRIKISNHPRNANNDYVFIHTLKAEKALGKPLPDQAVIHHFPSSKIFDTLILCENQAYHIYLHRRYNAFKACGHVSWRKCRYCKKWDDPKNLMTGRHCYHHGCHLQHCKDYYRNITKKFISQKTP